jgi:hypothetical protein
VNRVLAQTLKSEPSERKLAAFSAVAISCISDPAAVEVRMSGNEEVSQATKGDDSVTWIGRVK